MKASDQLLQDSQENHYADDPNAVMPTTGSGKGIKLITMRGKAYDDPAWENVLDCLTVEEMMNMVRLGGWQTAQLLSISKPVSNDQDGPAGISDELISGSAHCMGYPIAVVLASTWNQELVEQMGECIGEDGLKSGVQGWYAPGQGRIVRPMADATLSTTPKTASCRGKSVRRRFAAHKAKACMSTSNIWC